MIRGGLIGERTTERVTCGKVHLPGCFNPQPWTGGRAPEGGTACLCGERWWDGAVGTWHSRELRKQVGVEGVMERPVFEALGWDTYFLHAADCAHKRRKACRPACGGAQAGVWPHLRDGASA